MKLNKLPVMMVLSAWLLWGAYYTGIQTVTTAGTRVQLTAASPTPPAACISLTVQAKSSNTGTIYVGGSNVNASTKIGVALVNGATPAAAAYFSPSSTTALYSTAAIWLDATVSGDGVSYACYK